jgi:hypothetical protein
MSRKRCSIRFWKGVGEGPRVQVTTSRGDFVIVVYRVWAPAGWTASTSW